MPPISPLRPAAPARHDVAATASTLRDRLAQLRANEATKGNAENSNQTSICTPPIEQRLRPPASVTLNSATEAQLLAVLNAPLLAGESALSGNLRKEHALGAILATINIGEARTLHQRLSRPPVATDALATKFATLINERRQRLLAFIADTRRRVTIAQSRAR